MMYGTPTTQYKGATYQFSPENKTVFITPPLDLHPDGRPLAFPVTAKTILRHMGHVDQELLPFFQEILGYF